MRTTAAFIPIISRVFEVKSQQYDKEPLYREDITIFHSMNAPSISIRKYLERITKYAKCSDNQFILALIYIDRFIEHNPSFRLSSLNIHRLIISSIVISLKYDCDYFFNNSIYAKIGGISLRELNALEKEFLSKLDYNLYVSEEEFCFYHAELKKLSHSLHSSSPSCY